MSFDTWMDIEDVVYVYARECYSALKKKEVPFAATRVDLEVIMLSEVSQWETDYNTTHMWDPRNGTNELVILSPCLFNLHAEYITRNAGLEEAQAGIKIAGRNSINLRYADDTTLMAESEELKSLLMKVKEESFKLA